MASSSRQKTTMAKLTRERALRERRELKQAKKDARKRAAAETRVSESSQDSEQHGTDHDDAVDTTSGAALEGSERNAF